MKSEAVQGYGIRGHTRIQRIQRDTVFRDLLCSISAGHKFCTKYLNGLEYNPPPRYHLTERLYEVGFVTAVPSPTSLVTATKGAYWTKWRTEGNIFSRLKLGGADGRKLAKSASFDANYGS